MHLASFVLLVLVALLASCVRSNQGASMLLAGSNSNGGALSSNNNAAGIQLQQAQLDVLASSFRSSGHSSMNSDMDTISVIMRTLMPSMFNLFSNVTSHEYKAQFKDPCRFDSLLEIFSQLPAYFDIMAKKYTPRNDLVAYYSMQLASTFLVNNNSLTMTCLYNMMSLQTRLKTFSLDLMDNPEKNFHLVGLFGFFIKPVMGMLKQNAMMKIIDHVEKYENNDDLSTVDKFNVLNVFFLLVGLVAILANVLLIVLLRRSARVARPSESKKCAAVVVKHVAVVKPIYKKSTSSSSNHRANHGSMMQQESSTSGKKSSSSSSSSSQYKLVKSRHYYLNQFIRRKYTTRECLMIIAACHSLYILINYMIMNQTGLAAHALKGLSKFNAACKMAFFFSPPTTAYTILHQLAIWLLVYAVRRHARKLRSTRLVGVRGFATNGISFDDDDDSEETEDGSNTETQSGDFYAR